MQDIADKAGVTKTTVSLALRGDRRISVKTRDRIKALAKEMGYRPNPMVATLMAQVQAGKGVSRGTTIGLLAPHGNEQKGNLSPHGYVHHIYDGLRKRTHELGYGADVIEPAEEHTSFESCVRVMAHRGIRGVILPPYLGAAKSFPAEFDCSSFAVVGLGESQQITGIHRVTHSQYRIAYGLVDRAIRRGYRKICMHMSPEMNVRTGNKYSGGFFGALHDLSDLPFCREQLLYTHGDKEPFLRWVEEQKPDAILSQYPSDYDLLIEQGYSIPDKMGFALVSTTESDAHISGCFHDPYVLASAAVDLVTAHLSRNETGKPIHPKTVLTPEDWVEGETL
jgi:DNA-binding LacI/PurR family transcriptional regulator